MFLAYDCRGLANFAGVCVTDAYEFFDGSEDGCKRLQASTNEMLLYTSGSQYLFLVSILDNLLK